MGARLTPAARAELLLKSAEAARAHLLQVYELAFDDLGGSERDALSKARTICGDIVEAAYPESGE